MDAKMKEFEDKVNLAEFPQMVKVWLTMFIVVMGLAYCLSILNVYANTGMTYKGVADRYNGNEAEQIFAPDFKEIAGIAHTHMGAMGMMFFLMALPFLFTKTLPYWLKKVVLVDSFFAVLIANASFWLIRFSGRPWAILMILSGMLLGVASLFMLATPLYEMWLQKYFVKKPKEVK
jgi:hypothetical protein